MAHVLAEAADELGQLVTANPGKVVTVLHRDQDDWSHGIKRVETRRVLSDLPDRAARAQATKVAEVARVVATDHPAGVEQQSRDDSAVRAEAQGDRDEQAQSIKRAEGAQIALPDHPGPSNRHDPADSKPDAAKGSSPTA